MLGKDHKEICSFKQGKKGCKEITCRSGAFWHIDLCFCLSLWSNIRQYIILYLPFLYPFSLDLFSWWLFCVFKERQPKQRADISCTSLWSYGSRKYRGLCSLSHSLPLFQRPVISQNKEKYKQNLSSNGHVFSLHSMKTTMRLCRLSSECSIHAMYFLSPYFWQARVRRANEKDI